MSARHFHPVFFGQSHQAVVSDTRQDSTAPRREVFVTLDTDEVSRTAFVNIPMVFGIEEETVVPHGVCRLGSPERGGIVTAHFELACTARSRSVHRSVDDERGAVELTRIVRTDRGWDDNKLKIPSRADTQTRRRADEQRSEIERCACAVRWQEVYILF